MADVAVIGAGALGMAGARRLAMGGARVTVFEREDRPGGLVVGFKVGPSWFEKFYHHLFQTDRRMPRSAVAMAERTLRHFALLMYETLNGSRARSYGSRCGVHRRGSFVTVGTP